LARIWVNCVLEVRVEGKILQTLALCIKGFILFLIGINGEKNG
jgi:hypothetical protein